MLKVFLLAMGGAAVLWRLRTDPRLPWTVLSVLACVFLSRVYWLTAIGTLRAGQLACLVLWVHFLFDLLRRRRWPRLRWLPLLLVALLPLMVLSSLLASPFPLASLKKTLIYFPYLGGFVALFYFLDSGEKLEAAWDFLVRFGTAMMAISLAGYLLFLLGIDLGMVRVEAGILWLRGSLVNPNIFGAAAGMVLISTWVRSLLEKNGSARSSFFDLGALAVAAAVLVVSFSRAAWILTAVTAAAVFLYGRRQRGPWRPAVFVLLLSVLLTSAITIMGSRAYNSRWQRGPHPDGKSIMNPESMTTGEFGEPEMDRFFSAPGAASVPTATPFKQRLRYNSATLRWRFSISIRALRDWRKSPIIGRGTDSMLLSHPTIPQYYLPVTWVAILHDWGIIALALYGAFLLLTGFRLGKRIFRSPAPSGPLMAISFIFFFQTLQTQFSTTLQLESFWVLAAVFAVAADYAGNDPAAHIASQGQ